MTSAAATTTFRSENVLFLWGGASVERSPFERGGWASQRSREAPLRLVSSVVYGPVVVIPLARWTLFSATAATALVSAGTALGLLESRAWAAGAVVSYVALITLGLKKPSMRMFTDALARQDTGAALVIDVGTDSAEPLLALAEAHGARLTIALTVTRACAAPDFVRACLAAGHALALSSDEAIEGRTTTRSKAINRSISQLERETVQWEQRFADLDPPELWLTDALATPALQRLADAYDRTLVAPSRDLRAVTDRGPLREALTDALEEHAIVRVLDTPALRAELPAVLDAVARLGVPVRALTLPEAA